MLELNIKVASYHLLYLYLLQAQGRGRAEGSSYTLVEVKNSGVAEKECVNEYRKDMMNKAIDRIRALNQKDYDKRVCSLHALSCQLNPHCCKTVPTDGFSFLSSDPGVSDSGYNGGEGENDKEEAEGHEEWEPVRREVQLQRLQQTRLHRWRHQDHREDAQSQRYGTV